MNIEEAIEQLKSLKEHCKTMDDEIFKKDVEAIDKLLAEYKELLVKYSVENEKYKLEHEKYKKEHDNWKELLHFYNQRVSDIIKLENKIEDLENGDLTTVYMSGFYDGEKKWKDKIKAKIEELKQDEDFYREQDRMYEYEGKLNLLQSLLQEG